MQNLILYHANCSDGLGAAYAAWKKFGDDAEYVPVHYGNPPPDVTGKRVYILDFSYPRLDLIIMEQKAEFIQVLDHHKTAKADLDGLPYALFDMEKSGCVLAWEYFHPDALTPIGLLYIQDRDLWRFNYEQTKAFCEGFRTLGTDFEALDNVFSSVGATVSVIKVGEILLKAFDEDVKQLMGRAHTFLVRDRETKIFRMGLAVNANTKYASELGNQLAKKSGVCGLVYSYDGARKEWQYSLRSTDEGIDVSRVAKDYGGGGHRNAAGFASTAILWGIGL